MTPRLSVVIPVHDEAATLGATLRRMIGDDTGHELEVVVVANGCTDGSAAIARAVSPRIRVIEIPDASKIAALNAGDAAATTLPRAYVDADVRIEGATLLALADRLSTTAALVAAPGLVVDAAHSGWAVRQYFRVWRLSEYHRSGHVGSGVYAVSAAGRSRWAAFPPVTADDRFVQLQFAAHERVGLPGHTFAVPAPRTLRAQIRRNSRILAGNAELTAHGIVPPPGEPASGGARALILRALRRPALWPGLVIYSCAYAAARLGAARMRRRDSITWNRDDTTRGGTSVVDTTVAVEVGS